MKLTPGPPENPLGLPAYRGSAIGEVGVKIGNAGAALTRSLSVDPETWDDAESFYAIVRLDVTGFDYKHIQHNEGLWKMLHVCRATDAIVCPEELFDAVDEAVNGTRDKIIAAEAAAAGPPQVPGQGTIQQALDQAAAEANAEHQAIMAAGGYPTDDLDEDIGTPAGVDPTTGEIQHA